MPIYVDYIGLNTLVSSSFGSTTNIISSSGNHAINAISLGQELAAINTHRNGPYGFCSWKQIRASQNPMTRYHNKNSDFTFITQPGPAINIGDPDDQRVRQRYSRIYRYEEPVVTQKTAPLVWSVGRHVRKDNSKELQMFSMLSAHYNNLIRFSNDKVNSLLRYNISDEELEYMLLKDMYLDGGLNDEGSPITYWEFLKYSEVVYPRPENMFRKETRGRTTFVPFYSSIRSERHSEKTSTAADIMRHPHRSFVSSSFNRYSDWPMDEGANFISKATPYGTLYYDKVDDNIRQFLIHADFTLDQYFNGTYSTLAGGTGLLMSRTNQYFQNLSASLEGVGSLTSSTDTRFAVSFTAMQAKLYAFNNAFNVGPLYARRTAIESTASVVSPSGMLIPETASAPTVMRFEGGAAWEANKTIERNPSYNSYADFSADIRLKNKNYTVIPEFLISNHVENIIKSGSSYFESDLFEVIGGEENNSDSSKSNFYKTYSTSDFLQQFEILASDHKDFTNCQILQLRCKAVKKFLPYQGFYPCQRSLDVAGRFYQSYKDHINFTIPHFENGVLDAAGRTPTFGKQFVLQPLFAPGVLFNTIKSGVAVDYPVINTGVSFWNTQINNSTFDVRIPFEALLEPEKHIAGLEMVNNEAHPSASISGSSVWDGEGDGLYKMLVNNFLAEVPEFFLQNGNMTTLVSKKQNEIALETGVVYGMRIRMRRSMNKTRNRVYHNDTTASGGSAPQYYFPPQDIVGNGVRETFTMYSRPSAFGPPTRGETDFDHATAATFDFEFDAKARTYIHAGSPSKDIDGRDIGGVLAKDSRHGYNFPFTPPYYHGEAWCDIILTGSATTTTIEEIIKAATFTYTRFDSSFYSSTATVQDDSQSSGAQQFSKINQNAVQLNASLNLQGIGKAVQLSGDAGAAIVVDTTEEDEKRWVIQAKFETPMLNFNNVSVTNGTLSIPTSTTNHSSGSGASVPRGMWHQYGVIPEENEGVFLEIGPIDTPWQKQILGKDGTGTGVNNILTDLSDVLGFSGISTKLGRLAGSKKVEEAVVAIPYIEKSGDKRFFELNGADVEAYLLPASAPNSLIGKSVKHQIDAMKKYVFPPTFDFTKKGSNVTPIAMYIFEFSHVFTQQDLADMWQGLMPTIGVTHQEAVSSITHPLLLRELLGGGHHNNNTTHSLPEELKWMVFKVKKRAKTSYFKKVVTRNFGINADIDNATGVTVDQFGNTTGVQYNWPYDFFSLVELASIDATVEFSNRDFTDWDGEELPPIDGVSATEENIDLSTGIAHEIFPEPVQGPEIQDADQSAEETIAQYEALQAVIASAGQALVKGTELKAQVAMDIVKMGQQDIAGPLAELRDVSYEGGGALAERYGGINFDSLQDALATSGTTFILAAQDSWDIPQEELWSSSYQDLIGDANNRAQQAYAIEFINVRNAINNANSVISQYGANSPQANAAIAQVSTLVTSFTSLNTNFFGN